jgi:hypothetical protein
LLLRAGAQRTFSTPPLPSSSRLALGPIRLFHSSLALGRLGTALGGRLGSGGTPLLFASLTLGGYPLALCFFGARGVPLGSLLLWRSGGYPLALCFFGARGLPLCSLLLWRSGGTPWLFASLALGDYPLALCFFGACSLAVVSGFQNRGADGQPQCLARGAAFLAANEQRRSVGAGDGHRDRF